MRRPVKLSYIVIGSIAALFFLTAVAGATDIQNEIKNAKEFIAAKNYDAAINILSSAAIATVSSESEAQYLLGDCYRQKKDYAKAISCYQKLLLADAGIDKSVLRKRLVETYISNNELDAAASQLNAMADYDPAGAASMYYIIGKRYQWRHMYADALKSLQKVLILSPHNAALVKNTKIGLMECHLNNRSWADGSAFLGNLIQEYPDDIPEICYVAGKLYQWQRKFSEAAQVFLTALGTNPKDSVIIKDIEKRLIDCYIADGKTDKGLALLETMLASSPSDAPDLYLMIGKRYQWQHEYAQAIRYFNDALEAAPVDQSKLKDITLQLLECYKSTGNATNVKSQAEILLRDHPDEAARWRFDLGALDRDTGSYDIAIQEFKDLIAEFPENRYYVMAAHVGIAQCMYALGKKEQALEYQQQYYQDKPALKAESIFVKAKSLYSGAKNYSQAVNVLKQLATDFPSYDRIKEAQILRASLMSRELKQYAEAKTLLKDSILPCSNPNDDAEARFQIAYCDYYSSNWSLARDGFQSLYDNTQLSKYRGAAKYMIGDCYIQLGDRVAATAAFEELIDNFKGTKWVNLAKYQLNTIR